MKNVKPNFTEDEKGRITADVNQIADKQENRLRGLTKLEQG